MSAELGFIAFEVGKHLEDVAVSLPLRAVCKDWKENISFNVSSADLDMAQSDAVEALKYVSEVDMFASCPLIGKLEYHVSPYVTSAEFESRLGLLNASLPALSALVLSFNNVLQQMGDEHLAALARLTNLRSLTLATNFDPVNFDVLSGLYQLSEFRVVGDSCAGLSDAQVESLAELQELEVLEFVGHQRLFTGATIQSLTSLRKLRSLVISSQKYALGQESLLGLKALTEACNVSLELTAPDIQWVTSFLKVSGAALQSLCVAVKEPATAEQVLELAKAPKAAVLVGLDLQLRGGACFSHIAAVSRLTGLRRLHLTSKDVTRVWQPLDISSWSALSELTHFHLHINPGWRRCFDAKVVQALAVAWPKLTHLHLRVKEGDALEQLGHFHNLQHVSLQYLNSTPGEVLKLESLPPGLLGLELTSITAVNLRCNMSKVIKFKKLQTLTLDGNFCLNDDGFGVLCTSCPGLQRLSLVLMGKQYLTASGLGALARCKRLVQLSVQDFREGPVCLSQECLRALSPLGKTLRLLRISTPDLANNVLLPQCFESFRKLHRLQLASASCQTQAAEVLGPKLPLCSIKPCPAWNGNAALTE